MIRQVDRTAGIRAFLHETGIGTVSGYDPAVCEFYISQESFISFYQGPVYEFGPGKTRCIFIDFMFRCHAKAQSLGSIGNSLQR